MQEQAKPQPVSLVEGRSRMSTTFHLTPFITEWERAKALFISHVAREIDPGLRPGDVTSSFSGDMSESWCKCRISGGAIIATLRSDSIEFDVPRPFADDYGVGARIIGRATQDLLTSLGCENFSYFFYYGAHVEVTQGSSERYLARFACDETDPAMASQSGMRRRPAATFLFRSDDGSRELQKKIEQSEVISGGLFMVTSIYVSINEATSLDDELKWIVQVGKISDHAAGIVYSKDKTDAETDS